MTSIAMRMKVGTAAGAIALAASFPAVASVSAAPALPMPAAPIQVLDNLKETTFGFGNLDLFALMNGSNTEIGSTILNPGGIFQVIIAKVQAFIQLICYHFTGGGKV